MPHINAEETSEMLERLLDHDRIVEQLQSDIAVTKENLKDQRESLKDAVKARSKLSYELRQPTPLLSAIGRAS